MRVFLFAPCWYEYEKSIARALQQHGHEVHLQSYIRIRSVREWLGYRVVYRSRQPSGVWYSWKDRDRAVNERLLAQVRHSEPDLLLIVKGEVILPWYLEQLKADLKGVPLINWIMDSPFRYPNVASAAHLYDVFFSFEPTDVQRLRAVGVRAFFLPVAFDPEHYRPLQLSIEERRKYGCDIAFVGTRHPYREAVLRAIADFDVVLWGPSWTPKPWSWAFYQILMNPLPQRRREHVWGGEVAKIYNAAKICLNIHHPQSEEGLNPRTFEILGAGGFQVVDYKRALVNLFDIGRELICYTSLDELRDLLRYYLQRPAERAEIARRGHERACREHSFYARVGTMLDYIRQEMALAEL